MLYDYAAAGRGLKLVVISVLVGIVAGLFAWIPFLGILLTVAGPAVAVYGYYIAAKGHPDYTLAMYLSIAGVVLGLLQAILGNVFLIGSLLGIANIVCNALIVHIVCGATATLLDACGKQVRPEGALVWKIYVACALISAVLSLLGYIPVINILAGLLLVPVAIAMVVAAVLYLVFLWNAGKSLEAA